MGGGEDFLIWQAAFGGDDGANRSRSVPEPSTAGLLLILAVFVYRGPR